MLLFSLGNLDGNVLLILVLLAKFDGDVLKETGKTVKRK